VPADKSCKWRRDRVRKRGVGPTSSDIGYTKENFVAEVVPHSLAQSKSVEGSGRIRVAIPAPLLGVLERSMLKRLYRIPLIR